MTIHRGVTWFMIHHHQITNAITAALTAIERARGFLEAATLSEGIGLVLGQ